MDWSTPNGLKCNANIAQNEQSNNKCYVLAFILYRYK